MAILEPTPDGAPAPGLVAMIQVMPPEQKAGALKALDACTRPLTAREIEFALRQVGVSKSRAAMFAGALKRLAIVAVCGEQGR